MAFQKRKLGPQLGFKKSFRFTRVESGCGQCKDRDIDEAVLSSFYFSLLSPPLLIKHKQTISYF